MKNAKKTSIPGRDVLGGCSEDFPAMQHSSPGKTLSLVGSLERDAKLEAEGVEPGDKLVGWHT